MRLKEFKINGVFISKCKDIADGWVSEFNLLVKNGQLLDSDLEDFLQKKFKEHYGA